MGKGKRPLREELINLISDSACMCIAAIDMKADVTADEIMMFT